MKLFNTISQDEFLQKYWQKKPLLIKNAFADFNDLISPDELAGLACENEVESRRIAFDKKSNSFNAEIGPFDSYDSLGDEDWTLVVQAINHWVRLDDFLKYFDFIPKWRFDDVMSSFAAKGGSVGPHIDYYDVFICQGSGQRRWKVGERGEHNKDVIAHEKLLHTEPFKPIIDEILSSGDILYLPPGYPHEGVSLSPSMSFSVGYKSTNENEIISGFADYLLDHNNKPTHLTDPERNKQSSPSMISDNDLSIIKQFMLQTIKDPIKLNDFIARYYSTPCHELNQIPVETDYQKWEEKFKYSCLHKLDGLKTLYIKDSVEKGIFYINGEQVCSKLSKDSIEILCNKSSICYKDIAGLNDSEILKFLFKKTETGFWYFDDLD